MWAELAKPILSGCTIPGALFQADFGDCFICFCDLRRRQGVVSNRAGSLYKSGPSRNWLKTKSPDFVRT
jgi:hypothetical protein